MYDKINGLISVIVPIYNVEQYICRCIDSIIGQTYKKLEIILVDDGSPDNCGKICDEYAQKDRRIRVVHKQNGGLSDARNAGIEIATGEYLGFVDGDDYIASDMYKILLDDLQKYKTDMSMCAIARMYNGKVKNRQTKEFKESVVLSAQKALKACLDGTVTSVMACNKLYKRSIFNNVRYPYGKTTEDAFVIVELFENITRACINPKQLYFYDWRPDSISGGNRFKERDLNAIYAYEHVLEIVKKEFPELESSAKTRLVWAHMYVLDKSVLSENEELNIKLQKYIRKNVKYIKNMGWKRKIITIVLCLNLNWYKKIILRFGRK